MVDLTEDERRQYAAHLILERARNVPFLDIAEGVAEFLGLDGNEYLDNSIVELVDKDIRDAIIRVSWSDNDDVYSDNFGDEEEG